MQADRRGMTRHAQGRPTHGAWLTITQETIDNMTTAFIKKIPNSIAIFGASGHIGGPMARWLKFHAPQVRLRLIGSNPNKVERLREEYPGLEVVQANYFDQPSLDAAMAGIEGLFVLTQSVQEAPAMKNLVAAIRKAGCLIHMIRIVGLQPDMNPRRIPKEMRDYGLGLEVQHPIARQVLDDADMPVTYFNIGASFMDNYLRMATALQETDVLTWPNRPVPYIDPREVGEAAARMLMSDDARHVYQFYTMNNGDPAMRVTEVATLMRDVFLRPIVHDGSREGFEGIFRPLEEQGVVPPGMPKYLWNMFQYEEAHAPVWVPNQFLERTLGRRPTTMRSWLQEHRQHFVDDDAPAALPRSGAAAGEGPRNPGAAIDGIWDCFVSTPVGKEPHELVIRSAPDGTLTGEMKNMKNGISMPLQKGRHSDGHLTWSMQLVKPLKLTLKVSVQVNGNELAGQATAIMVGKVPIQGTKRVA